MIKKSQNLRNIDPNAVQPSGGPIIQRDIISRMKRAMKLENSLYEEVEHDPIATTQGLYIIGAVSAAQAVGRALERIITGRPLGDILVTGTLGFLETAIGLAIWSYILYFIGTKLFKGTATPQEVWRTTGFARSPGIFFIIPFIGFLVNIWILIAYVKAGKQALDLSTTKTILAAIISALPFIIIQGLLLLLIEQIV